MHFARSEEIGEILTKYDCPDVMTMDQDGAYMSSSVSYFFNRLTIKLKTVGAYNNQYLQA